jgi:hypothetical protein
VSTLTQLSPLCTREVVASPTPRDLNQLRKAKNEYDMLWSRANAVKTVLKTLLDVDEDLALMQLTELQRRGDEALDDLLSVDVEHVELLLETYLEVT